MVNVSLTKEELVALAVMVTYNRDSAKMQKDTNFSYTQSIKLHNKLVNLMNKNISWAEQSKILGR